MKYPDNRTMKYLAAAFVIVLGVLSIHALIAQAQMMGTPFWSAAAPSTAVPPPPAGGCGTEAAPSQAVAAGFTTCAANFDFTASTGTGWQPSQYAFSGNVSTTANWLDCGGSNSALPWHSFVGSLPCSQTSIVTDPTYGGQVMDFNAPGGSTGQNIYLVNSTNFYSGPETPGFPNGMYWEATVRDDTNSGQGGGGLYTWQVYQTAPALAFNIDMYPNGNGDQSSGAYPTVPQPGGYYWSVSGGTCYIVPTPCNTLIPPGWSSITYHKYGFLITTDGSTHMYGCAFIDGVLQGCDVGNNVTSGNSGEYAQRNFFILQNDLYGTAPFSAVNQYVKYIRVWTCANWATQQCNGSTLVNGPPPLGLTYYH